MKYYDISTPINPETVTWDDETPPGIKWHRRISDGDYVNLSSLQINNHAGTHVDAPYHFIESGKRIHQLDLSIFIGDARVVEINEHTITASLLEKKHIPSTERILLKTGGSRLYAEKKFKTDFPALDESGARWLVERGVKLIGIEYLSIEHYGDASLRVHHVLLSNEIVILEGLNLEDVPPGEYRLIALPLNLDETEAAPVRAVLEENASE